MTLCCCTLTLTLSWVRLWTVYAQINPFSDFTASLQRKLQPTACSDRNHMHKERLQCAVTMQGLPEWCKQHQEVSSGGNLGKSASSGLWHQSKQLFSHSQQGIKQPEADAAPRNEHAKAKSRLRIEKNNKIHTQINTKSQLSNAHNAVLKRF